jgi:hypothetical protein
MVGQVTAIGVAGLSLCLVWLDLSTLRLPEVRALKAYLPKTESFVPPSSCLGPSIALPSSELNQMSVFLEKIYDNNGVPYASEDIARTVFCDPAKTIPREVKELRVQLYLRLHFSRDKRWTIYLNRINVGDQQYGVAYAAQYYFNKQVSQLSIADEALILVLPQRPNYYSPYRHPDRALVRRNDLIESLKGIGAISRQEAETASSAPLGVIDRVSPQE